MKACEKWRADAECCTTMMSRLGEERQQALQQLDEVGRACQTLCQCMTTLILCLISPIDMSNKELSHEIIQDSPCKHYGVSDPS